jgi:hypothetical protein
MSLNSSGEHEDENDAFSLNSTTPSSIGRTGTQTPNNVPDNHDNDDDDNDEDDDEISTHNFFATKRIGHEENNDRPASHDANRSKEKSLSIAKPSPRELDPRAPQRVVSNQETPSYESPEMSYTSESLPEISYANPSPEMLYTPNVVDMTGNSSDGWLNSFFSSPPEENPIHGTIHPVASAVFLHPGSPLSSPELEHTSPKAYQVVQAIRAANNPHHRSIASKKSILMSPNEDSKNQSLAVRTPKAIYKPTLLTQGLRGQRGASYSPKSSYPSLHSLVTDGRRASSTPRFYSGVPDEFELDMESTPPILRKKTLARYALDEMQIDRTNGPEYQDSDISMMDASPYTPIPQASSNKDQPAQGLSKRAQWYKSADRISPGAITPELMDSPMDQQLSPLAGKLLAHNLTEYKHIEKPVSNAVSAESPFTNIEHQKPPAIVNHDPESPKPLRTAERELLTFARLRATDPHFQSPSTRNDAEQSEAAKKKDQEHMVALCALASHRDRAVRNRGRPFVPRLEKPEKPVRTKASEFPNWVRLDVGQILIMPPGSYVLSGRHVDLPVSIKDLVSAKRILTSDAVGYLADQANGIEPSNDPSTPSIPLIPSIPSIPSTPEVRPRSALKSLFEKGKSFLFSSQSHGNDSNENVNYETTRNAAGKATNAEMTDVVYETESDADKYLRPIVNHQRPGILKRSALSETTDTDKNGGSRKRRATTMAKMAQKYDKPVEGLRHTIRGDPSSDQNIVDRVYNKIVNGKTMANAHRRRQARKWTLPFTEGDAKLIVAVADRIAIPKHMANPENRRGHDNIYVDIAKDSTESPTAVNWEQIMPPDAWQLRKSEFEALLDGRAEKVFVEATNILWGEEEDAEADEELSDIEEVVVEPERPLPLPPVRRRHTPKSSTARSRTTHATIRRNLRSNSPQKANVAPVVASTSGSKDRDFVAVAKSTTRTELETANTIAPAGPKASAQPTPPRESGGFRGFSQDIFYYTDSSDEEADAGKKAEKGPQQDDVGGAESATESEHEEGLDLDKGPSQEELDWAMKLYNEKKEKESKGKERAIEERKAAEVVKQAAADQSKEKERQEALEAQKNWNRDHAQDFQEFTKLDFEMRMAEKRSNHQEREAKLVRDPKTGRRMLLFDVFEEEEFENREWEQRQLDVIEEPHSGASFRGRATKGPSKTVRFADPIESGPTGSLPPRPRIIKFPDLEDRSGVHPNMQRLARETIDKEGTEVAELRGMKFLNDALAWYKEKKENEGVEKENMEQDEQEEEL